MRAGEMQAGEMQAGVMRVGMVRVGVVRAGVVRAGTPAANGRRRRPTRISSRAVRRGFAGTGIAEESALGTGNP